MSFPAPVIPASSQQASAPMLLPMPQPRDVGSQNGSSMEAGGRSQFIRATESNPVPSMLVAEHEPTVAPVTAEPRTIMGGFFGNAQPYPPMGMQMEQPSMPMQQQSMFPHMLQDANSAPQSMSFDECPLFDSKRGRKFTGTSQMPGEASKRISLSIGAIRERGKNVEARLSTLEGQRVSKEFTGTLQQNPLKLILTPVMNPRSFGTFLTHMPWYSNSPTKIELALDLDGKMLIGNSIAGEEFELVGQPDRSATSQGNPVKPSIELFDGFDDPSAGATLWTIQVANADSPDPTVESWEFQHLEDGEGGFKWHKDGRVIASGRYAEDARKGHLDIALKVNGATRQYLAKFQPKHPGDGLVVCVPRRSVDDRPSTISAKNGTMYFIQRAQTRP